MTPVKSIRSINMKYPTGDRPGSPIAIENSTSYCTPPSPPEASDGNREELHSQFHSALRNYQSSYDQIRFKRKHCPGLKVDDVEKIVESVERAHIRICFNSGYFFNIAEQGYKNHKKLPSTANTADADNFLRRLKAEKDFFHISLVSFQHLEKINLREIKTWESFKKIFDISIPDRLENAEDLSLMTDEELRLCITAAISDAGFIISNDIDRETAPIYGLLETEEGIIQINKDTSDIDRFYGKSCFILKKHFNEISTLSINDSFDLSPANFSIRNDESELKENRASVLCQLQDTERLSKLLSHYLEDSINYLECHIHTEQIDFTAENIDKVIVSKSELLSLTDDPHMTQKITAFCDKARIPLEFID